MASNLNIKYGKKYDLDKQTKTAGNIYVAENSLGELEVHLDKPNSSLTERKRLDPRIFVGAKPTGKTEQDIFNDYDVWIDTTGDPTGVATISSNGLMSSTNVIDINTLKTDMSTVKTKIDTLITALQDLNIQIKKGPWDSSMSIPNTLTVVMPSSWTGDDVSFNPDGGVTTFGGSGS